MKKGYLLLIMVLFVYSCGISTNIVISEIKEKTEEYDIYVKESFIDSRNGSTFRLIDPANERMGQIVDSLVFYTKSGATDFFARVPKNKRPKWSYTLNATDTIYSVTSKIVSAKITANIYTGGAHGVTKFFAVNYSPMDGKFLSKGDIIDMSKSKKIDGVLKRYFKDKKGFTEEPTAALATVVNITNRLVIFTYEHYVLGPYSAGIAVIEVPRSEISDCINIK